MGVPPQLTFCMVITEGLLPHVTKPDGSFATTVDKFIAFDRVEGCCCYHLCQFLHVGRLDVHNVCKASQGGRQHDLERNETGGGMGDIN